MKMTEWQKKRTFGPVIERMKDGTFRALCTWCAFRVGNACPHVKPSRRMADSENTPEWCEMREDMIRDAKQMADIMELHDRTMAALKKWVGS